MKKNSGLVNIQLNDSCYSAKQENDWRKKCRQKTSAPFITYYRSEHRDNRQAQKLNLRVYLMKKKRQNDQNENRMLFQNNQIVQSMLNDKKSQKPEDLIEQEANKKINTQIIYQEFNHKNPNQNFVVRHNNSVTQRFLNNENFQSTLQQLRMLMPSRDYNPQFISYRGYQSAERTKHIVRTIINNSQSVQKPINIRQTQDTQEDRLEPIYY